MHVKIWKYRGSSRYGECRHDYSSEIVCHMTEWNYLIVTSCFCVLCTPCNKQFYHAEVHQMQCSCHVHRGLKVTRSGWLWKEKNISTKEVVSFVDVYYCTLKSAMVYIILCVEVWKRNIISLYILYYTVWAQNSSRSTSLNWLCYSSSSTFLGCL